MKKIIASITFVCYLAVTTGILVNVHYCMNRLASLQFFVSENRNCPKCGMHINKSHGCCRDEVKIIKMEVDQKNTSHIVFELPAWSNMTTAPSECISSTGFDDVAGPHYHIHSPPLLNAQNSFLLNCVFRI